MGKKYLWLYLNVILQLYNWSSPLTDMFQYFCLCSVTRSKAYIVFHVRQNLSSHHSCLLPFSPNLQRSQLFPMIDIYVHCSRRTNYTSITQLITHHSLVVWPEQNTAKEMESLSSCGRKLTGQGGRTAIMVGSTKGIPDRLTICEHLRKGEKFENPS